MENRVRERGEERDGLGGAGESSEAPWQCWPVVVVKEDEPLRFFDYLTFCEFYEDIDRWVL